MKVMLYYCISTVTQIREVILALYTDFDRNSPVFLQIREKIKTDILNGVYPPDSQVPAVRQLALDMSVNPNTVQKALAMLEESGLIITKGTLGRFVTGDTALIESIKKRTRREILGRVFAALYARGITKEEIFEFMKEDCGNE
jgi:DNA-binding transcriptional regulator YhcF (GntR family)